VLQYLLNLTLAQIALAIIGIGFIIAFHELGHYVAARVLGMRVLRYSLGFGPRLFGVRRGEIDYQLAALPFGGFVQIAGMSSMDEEAADDPRSYLNAPRWKRWLVLAAGPGFNFIAAIFFFFVFFSAWPSPVAQPALELVEVHEGAAKSAGLVRGEFITHVNGVALDADGTFRELIAKSAGAPMNMTVLNVAGPTPVSREVSVTPLVVDGGFRLGVSPAMRWPSAGFIATVDASLGSTWLESKNTFLSLAALVRRDPGVSVGGPLAIVADMKDKIALGFRYYIRILAGLSVSLGVFNLLPVPGLDGIKMLWLTFEGVFRRNLNFKVQEVINGVGVLVLIAVMAVITFKDSIRLFFS
jgi:regulator of sigma E protease